tara:strand:+ start:85732 stop:85839 length:108 start_codon:yes stop_codon:yes gene_type:complete
MLISIKRPKNIRKTANGAAFVDFSKYDRIDFVFKI